MRASRLTALVAAAMTLPAVQPRADGPGTTSAPLVYGYVEVTSNYVSRGLSQTIGGPSAQVEIDVNPGPGLYANFSVANVDWVDTVYSGADAPVEVGGAIAYRAFVGPGVAI